MVVLGSVVVHHKHDRTHTTHDNNIPRGLPRKPKAREMISISTQCLSSDPEDVYIYALYIYICNEMRIKYCLHQYQRQFVVVMLVFYGPSTLIRPFQARPVDLSTKFLGKPHMQFTGA